MEKVKILGAFFGSVFPEKVCPQACKHLYTTAESLVGTETFPAGTGKHSL